jgi:hypothetical protein
MLPTTLPTITAFFKILLSTCSVVLKSSLLAVTTNNELVTSGKDATRHVTDYYGILQNIVEYTFGGAKELKVVFFQCDWFDPINSTRVDEFGIVEVKHESRYSGSNILLAHQVQ